MLKRTAPFLACSVVALTLGAGCTTAGLDQGTQALAEGRTEQGVGTLRSVADGGGPDAGRAQFRLGRLYLTGTHGVERDPERGKQWFVQAADNGVDQAAPYQAAYSGDVEAQFQLGLQFHPRLDADEAHPAVSRFWFKKAAAQDHEPSRVLLKALAADREDALLRTAFFEVAVAFYQGRADYPERPDLAVYWWHALAQNGEAPRAAYNLGQAYRTGTGVGRDGERARYWLAEAARQGMVKAQYQLGNLLARGDGNQPSTPKKAAHWLQQAADAGSDQARNDLAVLYRDGRGMAQDPGKARSLLRTAAKNGVVEAQANLAGMVAAGTGGPTATEAAVRWYRKAANQGHVESQYRMGLFHAEGRTVAQDRNKATEWFQKAASAKHVPAMNRMGIAFLRGYGVDPDRRKARQWFEAAANAGSTKARRNLAVMDKRGS